MTWTYTSSPGVSTAAELRDAVRLLIGDTDTNDQLVSDEEIAFALSQSSNDVYSAAAIMCNSIAASYSRRASMSIDNPTMQISFSDVAKNFRQQAKELKMQSKEYGSTGVGNVIAGGVSIADMNAQYEDTDRVEPAFTHRRFRNPGGSSDDNFNEG